MTRANLPFYAACFLLSLGGSLLLAVAHVVVLFEAWRKGLTAFGRWLMPSTLASVVFLVARFPSIGTRLGFRALSALFLYGLGLNALATALAVVAVFQLWRLVRGWPVGAGGIQHFSRQAAERGEGVCRRPPARCDRCARQVKRLYPEKYAIMCIRKESCEKSCGGLPPCWTRRLTPGKSIP